MLVGSNDANFTPATQLSNPFPTGLAKPVGNTLGDQTGIGKGLTIFDPAARSPRVQQFSFDIQRQLPSGVVMALGYVGSRTANLLLGTANININALEPRHFTLGSALNQAIPNPYFQRGGSGVVGAANVSRQQLLRPFSAFSDINYQFSDQNMARYDSMVVKAQKRFSSGLTFLGTYTFSKNYDASSGGAGNNLNGGNVGPQNPYDMAAEYGLSNVDAPHRLTSAITYELPFGLGKPIATSRMLDYFVGGWSINAVSVFQSGYPLQIRQNSNNNAPYGYASQRPNATGVSPMTEGSFGQRIDNWINPAAFSQVGPLAFGNLSRTISMRGPGQVNWDISIFKTVTIAERYKAQFARRP